ncbi:Fatty acid desaturase; Delta-9 fatty acid desaturase, partial [uncultured Microcoleus sp.]
MVGNRLHLDDNSIAAIAGFGNQSEISRKI